MQWILRLVPDGVRPAIGDLWFAPGLLTSIRPELRHYWLSERYRRDWLGKRAPLIVRLPNGASWCVDSPEIARGGPRGEGWTVTGETPRITVEPVIDYRGWRGTIVDGIMTTDDGRWGGGDGEEEEA